MHYTKRLFQTKTAVFCGLALFLLIPGEEAALDFLSGASTNTESAGPRSDCVRPEYYQLSAAYDRSDEDGDSMPDSWERGHGLDYNDPADAALDPDGDGYTNLEEYRAQSDPRSARYHPDIVVVTRRGFDCFYTAETGYINDDELLDILVRDPSPGYVPTIRDFVLVQQADNSFEIEDARDYELPELVSIQSAVVLAELNGDTMKDIALIGLSDFIPGVNDQIVFSFIDGSDMVIRGLNIDVIPWHSKDLDPRNVSFFVELNHWINDPNYFEDNATVAAIVPEIIELGWLTDENGEVLISSRSFPGNSPIDGCNGRSVRCFNVVADENDPSRGPVESNVRIEYLPSPYQVEIVDSENDPEISDVNYMARAVFSERADFEVKDFSAFSQDALALARNEFRSILQSGVMYLPSDESDVIYRVLRSHLGVRPLPQSYFIPEGLHYFFDVEYEHLGETGILGSIQGILDFVSGHFIRGPDIFVELVPD